MAFLTYLFADAPDVPINGVKINEMNLPHARK